MRRQDLIDAMHTGVRTACAEYGEWSGGEKIHDRGIESLMVSSVSRAVIKAWRKNNRAGYISLEMPFHEIGWNAWAAAKPGPKPANMKGAPRADLVLWNGKDEVRGIVEVKRKWSRGPCHRDIKRLITLLRRFGPERSGTIRTGHLVTMVVVPASRLAGRLEKIRKSVHQFDGAGISVEVCPDEKPAYLDDENGTAGYSVVIALAPKRAASLQSDEIA